MAAWHPVHTEATSGSRRIDCQPSSSPPWLTGQHPDLGLRASLRSLPDLIQPNPDLSDSAAITYQYIQKPWSEKYQAETETGLRAVLR